MKAGKVKQQDDWTEISMMLRAQKDHEKEPFVFFIRTNLQTITRWG